MSRIIIRAEKAPAAVGPYSQAVRAGNLLFISGQIPIDPHSGKLAGGGAEQQTKRVMENIGAILHSQGLSFADLVKTTVYLKSLADFDSVNRIYGEYFDSDPPARACVEVTRLPKDAVVEIEAVAVYG